MKPIFTLLILGLSLQAVFGQGLSVNETGLPPDPSAMLDIASDSKGMLVPRMDQTARDTISTPAVGLLIFNTTSNCFNFWSGSTWRQSCFDCDFSLPTVGNNGPICEGATLNLTCSSVPGATYQWTGPNGFVSSQQNPSIPNVTAAGNGLYSVIVTLNGCSSSPISSVVTVNATPATPTAGVNSNICPGDNINLTASPIVGATYSWTGPNGYTSNAQNPTITNASTSDNGTYSVTATVNGCTSNSSSVSVSVASTVDSFSQTLTADFNSNVNTNVSTSNDEVSLSASLDGGTGADGAYTATGNVSLAAGTYNFTSFTINPGVTVTVTGNAPLIIKSQGPVDISGTLNGDGNGHFGGNQGQPGQGPGGGNPPPNNGNNCGNWGAHGGGGSYGTLGTNGGNSAVGCASAHIGGTAGSTYGDPQISVLNMGSGGAGNGWCSGCNSGGMNQGGNGGGAVQISSLTSISVSGTITMDGANGVGNSTYASGASGAGSGGSIHLISPVITQTGTLTATGGTGGVSSNNSSYNCCGGNGGNGRIRMEYNTLNGSITASPSASTGSITVNTSGTTVTNPISPSNFCQWGVLEFTGDVSGSGTSLSVDVLDIANNPLATGVSSGTNLNTLPAVSAVSSIKLRANLSTSNSANTPFLRDWKVEHIEY